MSVGPRVAVVVVDHDGGEMTARCLRHLAATEWDGPPLRLVLVDNSSTRPLTAADVAGVPGVELVAAGGNPGFAGGVNIGLRRLGVGRPDGPDLVALINNDAFVEPGWLRPLVDAVQADGRLGAASAKLLFEPVFAPVTVAGALRPQPRGPALGVRVVAPPDSVYGDGFVAVRPGEWWTAAPEAVVYVPAVGDGSVVLGLEAVEATSVSVGGVAMGVARGSATRVEVPLPAARTSVVQNAGNELTPEGWVRDRGARQPDDGRWDTPGEVWGWCGGAVLLKADYLADVGWMDESFFLYWEDVDLSWRGLARGWRYVYVPASVVRHRHGASMGDRSPRFELLTQRNRLVVLARHAGRRRAAVAWARTAAEAAWFVWRDGVRALVGGHRPDWFRTSVRMRALAGAARLVRSRPSGGPTR